MKYAPCGEAAFRKTVSYCGYYLNCFREARSDATFKRTYDVRDNTTCSTWYAGCPC